MNHQIDHEATSCQYEINFGYTEALTMADRYAFMKFMIKVQWLANCRKKKIVEFFTKKHAALIDQTICCTICTVYQIIHFCRYLCFVKYLSLFEAKYCVNNSSLTLIARGSTLVVRI